MKQTLFLFAVILMLSCGSKTGKAVNSTDTLAVDSVVDAGLNKHSEAYIRQRIDTIYRDVAKSTYDSEGNEVEYIHNPFNRDSAYCSQRYYALMKEALQFSNEMGEILYDYDHWVYGQDYFDDWSYRVTKVYEITDSTALVDLVIHNCNDRETTIALRFERDDWYIDDFSPSEDGSDDKSYLEVFILEGLETREKAKALVGYWGWVGDDCPELLLRLEMTDKGLKVTGCDIYRMYGFDNATASYNGTYLYVSEQEYEKDSVTVIREFYLDAQLDKNGDLIGKCRLKHPLASKEYDGPIILRKDYFKYD
jgi:hypothetical protein